MLSLRSLPLLTAIECHRGRRVHCGVTEAIMRNQATNRGQGGWQETAHCFKANTAICGCCDNNVISLKNTCMYLSYFIYKTPYFARREFEKHHIKKGYLQDIFDMGLIIKHANGPGLSFASKQSGQCSTEWQSLFGCNIYW